MLLPEINCSKKTSCMCRRGRSLAVLADGQIGLTSNIGATLDTGCTLNAGKAADTCFAGYLSIARNHRMVFDLSKAIYDSAI